MQPSLVMRSPVLKEESAQHWVAFIMGDDIAVRFDKSALDRRFTAIQRKGMPTALRNALNDTVKGGRLAAQGAMRGALHRPTAYAQRGIVYERASKTNLVASVEISGYSWTKGGTPPANFLTPQVDGGMRNLKGFEVQLKSLGHLKAGEYAVPADRQRLNAAGNVTQGQINKIMTGLAIEYRSAGATRVATTTKGKARVAARGRYFVAKRGSHLHPGIWFEKPGVGKQKKIYPVMLFVRQRNYKKRFDFRRAVEVHAQRNLPKHFAEAFKRHVAPL